MRKLGMLVAVVFTLVPAVAAAEDAFLKLDGVAGESSDGGHRDWIDVMSFSYATSGGVSRTLAGGAGAGRVDISEITIVKRLDKASPVLLQKCVNGNHLPTATLTVRRAGRGEDYIIYKLTDVIVSSVRVTTTNDIPTESVTLSFARIEVEHPASRMTFTESATSSLAR